MSNVGDEEEGSGYYPPAAAPETAEAPEPPEPTDEELQAARLKRAKCGIKTKLSPLAMAAAAAAAAVVAHAPKSVQDHESKHKQPTMGKKRKNSPHLDDTMSLSAASVSSSSKKAGKEAPVKVKADILKIVDKFQREWAPILQREGVELIMASEEHNAKFNDILFQLNKKTPEQQQLDQHERESTARSKGEQKGTKINKTKSKLIDLNEEDDDRPASTHLADMDSSTDEEDAAEDDASAASKKKKGKQAAVKDDEISPPIVIRHRIAAGDFWIRIKGKLAFVFERKTVADLSGSIGGRSDRQKFKLKRLPIPLSRVYYLIEGRKPANPFIKAREVLMGAMTNILVRDRFEVIFTPSDEDTVLLLLELLIKVGQYVLGECSTPSLVTVHAYKRWQKELAEQVQCPLDFDPLCCIPSAESGSGSGSGSASGSGLASGLKGGIDIDPFQEDFARNELKYGQDTSVLDRLSTQGKGDSKTSMHKSLKKVKQVAQDIDPAKMPKSRFHELELEYMEAYSHFSDIVKGGKSKLKDADNPSTRFALGMTATIDRMTSNHAAAILNHFDCSVTKLFRFIDNPKRSAKEIQKDLANILFPTKASKVVLDKIAESKEAEGDFGSSSKVKTASKTTASGTSKQPKQFKRIGPALAKAVYEYMKDD